MISLLNPVWHKYIHGYYIALALCQSKLRNCGLHLVYMESVELCYW